MGALASGAARPVGYRDEIRMQGREALNCLPERALHLLRLRRKELERDADAGAGMAAGTDEIPHHHATPCADDTTASRGSRASQSDTAIFPSEPSSGGSVRCSAT